MADNVIVRVPEQQFIRGEDGYSPVVTIENIDHGHSITITDREHQEEGQTFNVLDGDSAYEQAVAGGYTGTEAQFNEELASFKELSDETKDAAPFYAEYGETTKAEIAAAINGKRQVYVRRGELGTHYAPLVGTYLHTPLFGSDLETGYRFAITEGTTQRIYELGNEWSTRENDLAAPAQRAETAAAQALTRMNSADASAQDAEAYAIGKRKGIDVGAGDPASNNNSKYYMELAAHCMAEASSSETAAASSMRSARNYASSAQDYAGQAASSASDAATAKGAAETAQGLAESAQAAAETAQGAAEDAQEAAEAVLASIPSDYTELSGDVDDLKSALEFANVTSMSSSERKLGRLVSNTGLWAYGTNSSHAIINTTSQNIEITASSNGNSFIAALRSYNFEDGQSADFSTVTGWTSVVSIPTGNTVKIAMPSDATCLYVLCVTTGNDRVPSSIIIDGYDVTQSALKNIGNIYNDATSYYDKVRLAMQEQNLRVGYLDGTSGQWKTSSSTRYSIIPVIAGQQIDIMAPYYPTLVIALLKTVNYKSSTVANFSAETGFTAPITLTGGMRKTFTVPSDANYMYILRLNGGTDRTPAFLRINGYDCLRDLDAIVLGNQQSTLLHLRVMEYNVGGYNYGTHIEPTIAQCEEKFPNYKALYSEFHPDVLFVTEFAETAGPGPEETGDPIDVNDVLYDTPFPYSWEGESTKGAVLKSKFPFFYTNEYQLSYSEDDFSTTTRYRLGRSFVNGKILTLVSIHIPVGHTQQHINARRYFITQIIDKVKDDDYPIIAGDTNLGGAKTSESSLAELQDTIDYLHSVGWEACNGGYLPAQKTNEITYIDNVFYKNNGKIIFGDFRALGEWYDRLASDHYPVYADLVLI